MYVVCGVWVCVHAFVSVSSHALAHKVECIEFCDAKNNEDMLKCVVYWRETLDKSDGAEHKAVNNPYQEHRQKLLQTQVDHSYKDATQYDAIDHIYDYISVREWCQGRMPLSHSKEVWHGVYFTRIRHAHA